MNHQRINITDKQIADFCKQNHIRKFAFYGSVLRDDFSKDSDIEILVDFDPEQPIGLMKMARMEIELSECLEEKLI